MNANASPVLYDINQPELDRRAAFTALVVEWDKFHLAYRDSATPHETIREMEERGYPDETKLAYAILTAPISVPCLLQDKLRVILHYMQTAGNDLYPHERLAIMGVHSLMVDLMQFHG